MSADYYILPFNFIDLVALPFQITNNFRRVLYHAMTRVNKFNFASVNIFTQHNLVVFALNFTIRNIPISFGLVIRTLINLQHNRPHSFCAYGEHIYFKSLANFCHLSKCEMINTHAAHAHPKTNNAALFLCACFTLFAEISCTLYTLSSPFLWALAIFALF